VLCSAIMVAQDGVSLDKKRSGRNRSGNVEKAEKLYDNLAYKAAIPIFNEEEDLSLEQMVQLANAYRLNHDTENAEVWYAQVVALSDDPEHQYFYAQSLQSNGRDKLAKVYFNKYAKATGGSDSRGEAFATSIGAKLPHTDVKIRNEKAINTKHLEFSPSFYKGSVVFVSTKSSNILDKKEDKWIKDNFMSLFIASTEEDNGVLSKAEVFALNLNTNFHEGPMTFSRTGRKIFFTRNTFNSGKRKNDKNGVMRLNIYSSSYEDGKWTQAEELAWNTDDYEEAHPSLSYDGQTLYFASNRPGGYGGMDLYYSELENGTWGEPINLGSSVNTAGTDAFPFAAADGSLYFASDGRGGKGGLDIFSVTQDGKRFTSPKNIGTPFNSEKDDFGYIVNASNTLGYFTSARLGGEGGDDIYSFVNTEASVSNLVQTVCVYESPDIMRLIEGAEVKVVSKDCDGVNTKEAAMNSATYSTSSEGTVSFPVTAGCQYQIEVSNNGYADNSVTLSIPANAQLGSEVCIPLDEGMSKEEDSVKLIGNTYNRKFDKTLPNVNLKLINLCTGEESQVVSSSRGEFSFGCVPCGCDYIITGDRKHFESTEILVSTIGIDCSAKNCADGNELRADLRFNSVLNGLNPIKLNNESLTESSNDNPNNSGTDIVDITELESSNLKAGSKIALRNIYYDFDEHYIRADAQNDLNHVASLMQQYPTMEIELGSHTDSRASVEYNWALAQRRAEAARQFLVQKGIDVRRIIARGYGESELRNRCADFVKCTETEHQLNRRTEVKIIRMDGNLEVDYLDSKLPDQSAGNKTYRW